VELTELTELGERVVGALAEKERTVPDSYPLTLNALVNACNQSSNRWPVMRARAVEIQATLDQLKAAGLVRFVHPARGERTTRFRQVLDERLDLREEDTAVLAVLMLRGPQTAGELRGRSERLFAFESIEQVTTTLQRLGQRPEPLVRLLERGAGERDARWIHLLGGDRGPAPRPPDPVAYGGGDDAATCYDAGPDADRIPMGPGAVGRPRAAFPDEAAGAVPDTGAQVEPNAGLVAAIEVLSARVAELEDRLGRLCDQLGAES
jgi:uncharacterized protein